MENSIIKIQSKQGDMIHLCKIQERDAWGICDFVVANENRLKAFFPKTLAQNLTPELAEIFTKLKSREFENKEEYLFTIKEEKTKKIIGLIYVKELKKIDGQGELAYCIDYNFESQGIITELVCKIMKYAYNNLNLKQLQILVHKSNLASIQVAKKSGFRWKKTLIKNFKPVDREAMDMELYEHSKN